MFRNSNMIGFDIENLYQLILNGTNGLKNKINRARLLLNNGDKKAYTEIKMELPFFLPHFLDGNGRKLKNIQGYTGIVILDLDNLSMDEAVGVRDNVFGKDEHCIMAFLSPSGKGVKALIATNATDISKAYETFNFVKGYYEPKVQNLLNRYHPFDESGKDATRICFLSYDPNCVYNKNYSIMDVKAEKLNGLKAEKLNGLKAEKLNGLKAEKLNIEYSCDGLDLSFVTGLVGDFLRRLGFKNEDGSGRHTLLTRLAGYLNGIGVGEVLACKAVGGYLLSRGLPESWVMDKVENAISSIYKQYRDQHGNIQTLFYTDGDFEVYRVGDYIGNAYKHIKRLYNENSNDRVLMVAETGLGKSTAVLRACNELSLRENEYIVFYTPNRDTAINLYNKNRGLVNVLAVGGCNWRESIKKGGGRVIIGVMDCHWELEKFLKSIGCVIRVVIVDEIHKVESDSSFRANVVSNLSKLFESRDVFFIGITATPTPYMCKKFLFDRFIRFESKREIKYDVKLNYGMDFGDLVEKVKQCKESGKRAIIRVGNKIDGYVLRDSLMGLGLDVLFVNKDTKGEKDHNDLATTGEIKTDVLITTKLLEDGISLYSNIPVEYFFVYSPYEIYNPIAVKQFVARVRNYNTVTCYIYALRKNSLKLKAKDFFNPLIFTAKKLISEMYLFEYNSVEKTYTSKGIKGINSSSKFINDNNTLNIFSVLNKATSKYFVSKQDVFEKLLEQYFGTIQVKHVSNINPMEAQKTELQKAVKLKTLELLSYCTDERFYNNLLNVFGKKYGYSFRFNVIPEISESILKSLGWDSESFRIANVQKIIDRIQYLKKLGVYHEKAVELVIENWETNKWNIIEAKADQLMVYKWLERGVKLNNAWYEKDLKTKETVINIIQNNTDNGYVNFTKVKTALEESKDLDEVTKKKFSKMTFVHFIKSYFNPIAKRTNKYKRWILGERLKIWDLENFFALAVNHPTPTPHQYFNYKRLSAQELNNSLKNAPSPLNCWLHSTVIQEE